MTFGTVQSDLTGFLSTVNRKFYLRQELERRALGPRTFYTNDTVVVKQDRLELTFQNRVPWVLLAEALVGKEIMVKKGHDEEVDFVFIKVSGFTWSFGGTDLASAERFSDDLCFLQQDAANERAGSPALAITSEFQAMAVEYRAKTVKPPVSEEQRRYIVQADTLSQMKDYSGAMDAYRKALEVDPVALPGCYFNMALLSAEQGRSRSATTFMKKYLLLVPNAKDARAAQDRILRVGNLDAEVVTRWHVVLLSRWFSPWPCWLGIEGVRPETGITTRRPRCPFACMRLLRHSPSLWGACTMVSLCYQGRDHRDKRTTCHLVTTSASRFPTRRSCPGRHGHPWRWGQDPGISS